MRIHSLMVFLGIFFSLKTYSSEKDYSQESAKEYMNECILETIEQVSEDNYWISGKDLVDCACYGNNKDRG